MTTARYGFERRARLHKPAEFDAAFERGNRLSDKGLSAVVLSNNMNGARLGLAVSKKVAARANQRNRIKRHIRESFRLNCHRLPAVDIVVTPRNACVQASAAELRSMLERLWNRIAQVCSQTSSGTCATP